MRYNLNNSQYRGRTIVTEGGQKRYEVYIRSQKDWIEVTAEVFDRLAKDIDREMMSNWRYHKRSVSIDQSYYRGEGEEASALTVLEGNFPQLSSRSAESDFLESDPISQIRLFIRKEYGVEMLELFEAVFVLRIPAEAYAQQIGKPASTVRSRKAKLIRELKKNKNFF